VAGVRFVQLAYSAVIAASFELLQCRDIFGERRFFQDATITCPQGWQAVPIILVILSAGLPLGLVVFSARRRRLYGDDDLVVRSLEGPFIGSCRWWPAVLLYERFVVTMIVMLIPDSLWRGVALLALCIAMLALGVWFRPFRVASENRLYCTGLVVLTLIATLSLPSRVRQSLASSSAFANNPENIRALVWLQFALSVLPIVAYACVRSVSVSATVRRSKLGKRTMSLFRRERGATRGVSAGDVTLEVGGTAEA
jgi:hypothetical protein